MNHAADESASFHSASLSLQVQASKSHVPAVRQQAAEECRSTYLAIFEEQNKHARDYANDWWKRPFVESADLLIHELRGLALEITLE